MYEQLHKSILEHVTLREDDWEICKSYLRPKQVKKRQYLFREGELCRELIFVEKGALYSFSLDDSGTKHVIAFAFEGWWISNLQSFLTGKRSRLFIEVLEDSNILMLNRESHEKLMEMIPAYERYHRIHSEPKRKYFFSCSYQSKRKRKRRILHHCIDWTKQSEIQKLFCI